MGPGGRLGFEAIPGRTTGMLHVIDAKTSESTAIRPPEDDDLPPIVEG